MQRHAALTSAAVLEQSGLLPGATVAEVASHHGGSWLPALVAAGLRPVAPTGDAKADLVVDVHGLAHDSDTNAALAAHARRLLPNGRLVLEFHHLLALVAGGQFDTVRHGHPVYLSLLALGPALARHGLAVTSAVQSAGYGGSLRVTARFDGPSAIADHSVERVLQAERAAGLDKPEALKTLQQQARRTGRALREHLVHARRAGRVVLGYGAPSKASVLLCSSGIGADLLPFTADISPAKHGRRLPGCGVPIRSPEELLAARPEEVLILTWDIAAEVAEQLAVVSSWGGRFVVPVPEPHELAIASAGGTSVG
ncbi:MAG: methyltransferase C-terminal domain-containing protein [Jatrophihabitans sp.]